MTEMDTTTALALAVLGLLVLLVVTLASDFLGRVGWSGLAEGAAAVLWLPGFGFIRRVGRRLGALP